MKKNSINPFLYSRKVKKLLLTMKLTILLLLACLMQVSASVYSQATRFNFRAENKQIVEVLKEIEETSNFRFFYQREQVDVERRVSVKATDATVENILDELFEGYGINYRVLQDNLILLTPGKEAFNETVNSQQGKSITGKVTDEKGEPLPGVSIVVKGTIQGTVTNVDGNYSISNIPENATLVFSFMGMTSQEVAVEGRTQIDVTLQASTIGIEEVVAIGYGTIKKSDLTGSVAEISTKDIQGKTSTDTRQMIQGVASGVTIIDAGGGPGENQINIRIRGVTTIGNNEPLIFVNGIEQNFSDINPDNIESITVLKDASATAIYGSRAANGVILVTIKKPVAQKLTVEYHGSFGFEQPTSLPKPLGLEKYMRLQNYAEQSADLAAGGDGNVLASVYGREFTEAMIQHWVTQNQNPDSMLWYPSPGGYFEKIFQTGAIQNHRLSISGGNEQISSRLSFQLVDQDGIMLQSNYIRKEIRFDNSYQVTNWLNLAASVTFRRKDIYDHRPASVIFGGYHGTPWSIPQYPDGSFGMNPRNNNANMQQLINGDRTVQSDYFVGNIKVEAKLSKNITYTMQYGGFTNNEKESFFRPKWTIYDAILQRQGRKNIINYLNESRIKAQKYSWRNLLNYNLVLDKHHISALAGFESQWEDRTTLSNSRQDFYSNDLRVIDAGSISNQSTGGSFNEERLRSYFGRVNYGFDERYLFEASYRYDGSSKFFGSDNQFGGFPSFSLAWNLSNESFWQPLKSTVRNLKLRGSWGLTGANTVDPYTFFSGVDIGSNYSFGGQVAQTALITGLVNTDLTWETTTQWNIGLDAELFDGKLGMTFEYWGKKTEDILIALPIPATVGFTGPFQNAGRVDNKGWDLSIIHKNVVTKDFSYSIRANLSDFKNKVISLNGTGPYIGNDSDANSDIINVIAEGESLNSMWGYIADGYYEESLNTDEDPFVDNVVTLIPETLPGSLRYVDVNGDGQITAEDKTIIGNEDPHYTYGITTDIQYRDFDLSIFIQGVVKQNRMPRGAIIEAGNWLGYTVEVCGDYWTPDNTDAVIPRPQKRSRHNGVNETLSSHWVIDASYIRLKNIQLGYTVPQSALARVGLSKMRFYISGTNLWWKSDAKDWGVDPEVRSGRLDFYPQTRQFVFGAIIGF